MNHHVFSDLNHHEDLQNGRIIKLYTMINIHTIQFEKLKKKDHEHMFYLNNATL